MGSVWGWYQDVFKIFAKKLEIKRHKQRFLPQNKPVVMALPWDVGDQVQISDLG